MRKESGQIASVIFFRRESVVGRFSTKFWEISGSYGECFVAVWPAFVRTPADVRFWEQVVENLGCEPRFQLRFWLIEGISRTGARSRWTLSIFGCCWTRDVDDAAIEDTFVTGLTVTCT